MLLHNDTCDECGASHATHNCPNCGLRLCDAHHECPECDSRNEE